MIIRNAECWVKEANAKQTDDKSSNLVAHDYYQKAIHNYRTIPRKLRDQHNVEERVTKLRELMNKARENSLIEMAHIKSEPIDISKLIEYSLKAVKGKELL